MDQISSLLCAERVAKSFPLPAGGEQTVLEEVTVSVMPGEIAALLGRSGSGKSALLRILAGLIPPSSGRVLMHGTPLVSPNSGVAMVFQSFALLPWLTVQENAELGLFARGVPKATCEKEALLALGMVGLEGFEGAYPKELSGGMRQRVGFARAFVMKPDVLMMDEPFSALDVLTAENLRGEISDLWERGAFPAKSVLIVTHDIEEAVLLADRVVILGANPGSIRGELKVDMPRPRDKKAPRFVALVDYIYTVMTNPQAPVGDLPLARHDRFLMLPHTCVGGISGLLEIVHDRGGRDDLPRLAESLRLEVDDLLPAVDASALLGFAKIEHGDVIMAPIGSEFATADVHRSHEIFKEQVLQNVSFISTVVETIRQKRIAASVKTFCSTFSTSTSPNLKLKSSFGLWWTGGATPGCSNTTPTKNGSIRWTKKHSPVSLSSRRPAAALLPRYRLAWPRITTRRQTELPLAVPTATNPHTKADPACLKRKVQEWQPQIICARKFLRKGCLQHTSIRNANCRAILKAFFASNLIAIAQEAR